MKKRENLFQIGEVASLCGITRRMLLNYEDLGLIIPTVVDINSGYRYYDVMAISRIQLILDLRLAGMSLPDIGKYLNGKLSADSKVAALEEQRRRLDLIIADMKLRVVKQGDYNIHPITVPEVYCLCSDYIAADVDDAIKAFVAAYESCIRRGISFAPDSYHFCEFPEDVLSGNFFKTENIPMRICISLDKSRAPEDAVIYPECKALSLAFCGDYKNSFTAYDKLIEYIKTNRYTVGGFPRELYMEGFFNDNGRQPITQIIVPVK